MEPVKLHCNFCLKKCNARSTLYAHKKTCEKRPNAVATTTDVLLAKIMHEIQSKPTTNTNNVNHINNDNKIVNVNLFLNEHAKDAVSFVDLLKNIQIDRAFCKSMFYNESYADKCGDEIKKQFDKLEPSKRPVHCVDGEDPRHTIFQVKHSNEWVAESDADVYCGIIRASIVPLEDEFYGRGIAKLLHDMDRGYVQQMNDIYKNEYHEFKERLTNRFKSSAGNVHEKLRLVNMIQQMAKNDFDLLSGMIDGEEDTSVTP